MKDSKIITTVDFPEGKIEEKIDTTECVDFETLMAEWEEKYQKRKWYNKVWDWTWFKIFYPFKPSEIRYRFLKIKSFFIRGKHGWAPMDVWSFDAHLALLGREGLKHLQKVSHGYPSTLNSQDEWNEILDKMIWTFDACTKIINSDWYLVRREDCESDERYEEVIKNYTEVAEKYGNHVMTEEEIVKYDEGWKNFISNFFSLWD